MERGGVEADDAQSMLDYSSNVEPVTFGVGGDAVSSTWRLQPDPEPKERPHG